MIYYRCRKSASSGWVPRDQPSVRFQRTRATGLAERCFQVQMNRLLPDWTPIRSIGAGVCEIRVHTSVEHRLIYVARFEEAVYVLHAFEKRTQKTPNRDIEI